MTPAMPAATRSALVIRAFDPADLDAIALARPAEMGLGREDHLRMADAGPTFSALAGDRVVLIAGLHRNRADYATAWALLGAESGPLMLALTRATRRVLLASAFRRIDMLVAADFLAGCKWAQLLGFAQEGTMRAYGPNGGDFLLYARVAR